MTDHSSDPYPWMRLPPPRREPIRESEWRADREWRLAWQQRERERRRQNDRPAWIVMGLCTLVAIYGVLASPEVDHPPDAAPAFVSEADKVYFAAPCIVHWDGPWDDLRLRTFCACARLAWRAPGSLSSMTWWSATLAGIIIR